MICILHHYWAISNAPYNSSFILEPKNQSKIANQVSWFRRISHSDTGSYQVESEIVVKQKKNDFGLSKTLNSFPIQFQHCGFSVISFILIKYFQLNRLFYLVSKPVITNDDDFLYPGYSSSSNRTDSIILWTMDCISLVRAFDAPYRLESRWLCSKRLHGFRLLCRLLKTI